MFTYKNKSSVLVLGILLSLCALQPALAVDGAEQANLQISDTSASYMAWDSRPNSDIPCADSKKQVSDKPVSAPDTWYERQSRFPSG